jgi:UDP-N-acetylglucosamine 2-epimerase
MKIVTIVGARPQFIKSAVFSKELAKQNIKEIMIHTGQHYDENMSSSFFKEFGIKKEDYNLNINNGNHAEQTSKMLLEIDKILKKENPDFVVVFGDTNSTLAGALACSKENLNLIHIEAGFRSYDKKMPEEINRVLSDHVSDYLFCVNQECVDCLKKEGIEKNVFISGDLMYEALITFANKESKILEKIGIKKNNYAYMTCHRQSNINEENIKEILKGVLNIDDKIVFSLHPRTRNLLQELNLIEKFKDKIIFIEPVNFIDSITLAKNSNLIITDSGGLLKEAYYLKKPCIILRENVEFKKIVDNKTGILTGANSNRIVVALKQDFNLNYKLEEIKNPSELIINQLKLITEK